MEKHKGILIADLSGYTALTEAHGASGAADIIDRYLDIVGRCLVGSSRLHERTGDEVMILSDNPDDLLSTALMLMQQTRQEKNFLLLHGGLHYGSLLERNGAYFGSAINLTARIAATANPGNFYCSSDFVEAAGAGTSQFEERGTHKFKNIAEEKLVYELISDNEFGLVIDPVCRMLVHSPATAWKHPSRTDVFFCSEECMKAFEGQRD